MQMQTEQIVVTRKEKRDGSGEVVRPVKVLLAEDEAKRVDKASTREDVLRRKDVHEATDGIPGEELEVLVAAVPFRAV